MGPGRLVAKEKIEGGPIFTGDSLQFVLLA